MDHTESTYQHWPYWVYLSTWTILSLPINIDHTESTSEFYVSLCDCERMHTHPRMCSRATPPDWGDLQGHSNLIYFQFIMPNENFYTSPHLIGCIAARETVARAVIGWMSVFLSLSQSRSFKRLSCNHMFYPITSESGRVGWGFHQNVTWLSSLHPWIMCVCVRVRK